ncbi:methyltransferase [Synechococcus sp. CCY9202]|uniref:methyltransferase n=1 Tax=Synechococcus sp. CCY9202 TaxID=174698 RepID=UPI002B21D17A|nr:methyltransferase [Synechococcus sp. CCY9202]MEA5421752.1 methyltransferase [Synechococcus sp. CCY9202]
MTEPDPSHIMRIASGFGASKALLSAVGLGLYTRLAAGSMTLAEIVTEFNLERRPASDFLDLLVSVDLLERRGDGPDALYCNTPSTGHFLDRSKPEYIGGLIEIWEMRDYRYWADLSEALRTGKPQNEAKHAGTPFFEAMNADPEQLEAFMDAMNGSSIRNFQALARAFPFNNVGTIADIGGADALLSREVAAAHPSIHCISFDLPAVSRIAKRKVAAAGLSNQITVVPGDFFEDQWPSAQVITMGMILHDWNLERKMTLIRKAFEALPERGALIVIEAFIDDARRSNTFGLFMSLMMLIEFGDAFDFTIAEFRDWCREVGFSRFETIPLQGPSSAVVAYKDPR